jgi:hypothetical protein
VAAVRSDVPALLGVLDDSPFTLNFSLLGGHSDFLDHLASRRCQNGPAESEISLRPPREPRRRRCEAQGRRRRPARGASGGRAR